jgi:pilus assembly protein Flp/PilA
MPSVIACCHTPRFTPDESGATSIEYALIACGISIAIISAVTTVGSTMMNIYYDKLLNLF